MSHKDDFLYVRRLAQEIISDTDFALDDGLAGKPCPLSRGKARSIESVAEIIAAMMSPHTGDD